MSFFLQRISKALQRQAFSVAVEGRTAERKGPQMADSTLQWGLVVGLQVLCSNGTLW